mgnify:CR=1 FL=1
MILGKGNSFSNQLSSKSLLEAFTDINEHFSDLPSLLSRENPCSPVRITLVTDQDTHVEYQGVIKGNFDQNADLAYFEINAFKVNEEAVNDFGRILIDTLFYDSEDFIGVFSLKTEKLHLINNNFFEHLGYQFPRNKPFWKYADIIFHPEDVNKLTSLINSIPKSDKNKWSLFLRAFHMNGHVKVFHLDIYKLDKFLHSERFVYILKDITTDEAYNHFLESENFINKILRKNTEAEVFVASDNKEIKYRLSQEKVQKVEETVLVEDFLAKLQFPEILKKFIDNSIEAALGDESISVTQLHQGIEFSIDVAPLKSKGNERSVVVVLDKKQERSDAEQIQELKQKNDTVQREIKQYKYRNEALLEQIHSLRVSLDIQKSFFVKYDLDGEITYVNRTFSEFLKSRPNEIVSGLRKPNILKEDAIRFKSAMNEIRAFPFKHVKADYRIIVKDKVYFTSSAISSLTDKDGNVIEYIASGMDITSQMKYQEDLHRRDERFSLIAKATNEAIWDWNILTNDSWWNETLGEMFGFHYSTKADINKLLKVILPEDRDRVKEEMLAALSEKKTHWSCEFRARIPGEEQIRYFYNRAYLNFTHDHMPERMLGSIMDITERKQSVLRYQQLNNKFELAVSAGKTGIWQYQINEDKFLFEKNLVGLYKGKSHADTAINTSSISFKEGEYLSEENNVDALKENGIIEFDFEKQIGKKAYTSFKKALLAYIRRGKFEEPFEFIQKRRGAKKKTIWILSRATVVKSDNGTTEQIIGTDTDITEQKAAEEQVRKAKVQTDEAMRTQEHFFSLMSHEIRSPLSGIIGMNDLLLSQAPRSDQEEFLSAIKFSADNLLVLINDLLDFSKIRAGKLEFEQNDFDLHLLLKNTYLNYKTLTKDKNIDFEVKKLDVLPKYILGDVTRLSQILNNLLSNAIKFTTVGSVELLVSVNGESDRDISLLFEVRDTGIGIPLNKQKKIFEPFAQASKDTSRKYGGTGLGLAIVKNLVELQGGELSFESEVGKGTTFKVLIDYKKEPKKTGNQVGISFSKNDLSYIRDFAGLNVLYIDDVPTNQLIMKGFASRWGIELETASDGFEGLHKVQGGNFELVLMDLQMPGIDGYETTRRIRSFNDKYYKDLPIIALTADISADVIRSVKEAGLTDYLAKPVNFDKLYQTFKKHKILPKAPKQLDQEYLDVNVTSLQYDDGNFIVDFSETDRLFGNDTGEYNDFLEKSVKELTSNHKSLLHALRNSDYELFRQVHHKMNSLLRLLKLTDFNEYLGDIKSELKKENQLEGREMPAILGRMDFYFSGILSDFREKQSQIKERIQ